MNGLLNDYFDKTYITSLLCDLSYNYYQLIYNIIIFPTILSSSLLTILNSSSLNDEYLKIINITLNGIITFILAINNNLKFNDKAKEFKDKKVKFNLLNHKIESIINKKKVDTNFIVDIDSIINEYDNLYNDISYPFPHHIKKKIINKYGNKRKLPNSLELMVQTPKIQTEKKNFTIPNLENQSGEIVNIQVN